MVNSEKMLPMFIRDMSPMKEVLGAEDVLLSNIEKIIYDMIEESKIVTINRMTLETVTNLINEFTQCECHLEEYPEELVLKIVIQREFKLSFNFQKLSANLKLLLPAHLKIKYENRIKMESKHYIGVTGSEIRSIDSNVMKTPMNLAGGSIYIGIAKSKNRTVKGEVV